MNNEFLHSCQVETPLYIVDGMWRIARTYKDKYQRVLDLGAGDGRFSRSGAFKQYVGYEIDSKRMPTRAPFGRIHIINKDAFSEYSSDFSLCIGNPPYIRANRLGFEWRDEVAARLEQKTKIVFKRNANLFVYFLTLALLRTRDDGLVVQLVPYEWVSRPSAKPLRDYINQKGWEVSVYRFNEDVFDNVLTTASITVIDKSKKSGRWRYYQLSKGFDAVEVLQPSGSEHKVLEYSGRHESAFALRGLSPGGQDIFTLTEYERLFNGLEIGGDVVPCVTSLKRFPSNVTNLTKTAFYKYLVHEGQKCWLIRSDKDNLSNNLQAYVNSIGKKVWGKYTTCTKRKIWWKYRIHPVPPILVASGFCEFGPKIMKNSFNAVALGGVYAVFAEKRKYVRVLEQKLREKNFEAQVVSHSNNLKKIEIRQLNSVISEIIEKHECRKQVPTNEESNNCEARTRKVAGIYTRN